MRTLLLAVIIMITVRVNPAAGDTYHDALVLGPGDALADPFWPSLDFPLGDSLTVVGHVVNFNAPLQFIPEVGSEYTYVFRDLRCLYSGTWFRYPDSGGSYAEFHGGVLEVFEDDSPDATPGYRETYADGVLLIRAQLDYFGFITATEPSHRAELRFTGGALFSQVSKAGIGYKAQSLGTFTPFDYWYQSTHPGWLGHLVTTIDVDVPVAVQRVSWGRIKSGRR